MVRFFTSVLEELGGGGLRVESLRAVAVPLVPQHAHEFAGQRLIESEDDPVQVPPTRRSPNLGRCSLEHA